MPDFSQSILGETSDRVDIATADDNLQAAVRMVSQSRRTLDIVSRNLDRDIYGHVDFVEAVKALILQNPHARVRLLVRNLARVARGGHLLLELGQTLSTFIEVRSLSQQNHAFNQAFLVADRKGVIFRQLSDRYEGIVGFNDLSWSEELTRQFDLMWDHGQLDPNTRRLHV